MAQTISGFTGLIERAYGIPQGLISKDPEAAALIATLPCLSCGVPHGLNPCPRPE